MSFQRVSSISGTAPQWNVQKEKEEIGSLSPEEREEIRRDIAGPSFCSSCPCCGDFACSETKCWVHHDMAQALERIPDAEKEAYLQALDQFPEFLMNQEAGPMLFLGKENYNPQLAAKAVARYWDFRKEIFEDRAFLPITDEEGSGALDAQDLALLRLEPWRLLSEDVHGRTVIYEQTSVFNSQIHSYISLARCMFAVFTKALQTSNKSSSGVVVVSNRKKFCPEHFNRRFFRRYVEICGGVFPVELKAMHFFVGSKRSSVGLLLPFMKNIMGKRIRRRFLLHCGSSEKIIDNELSRYGIQNVPIDSVVAPLEVDVDTVIQNVPIDSVAPLEVDVDTSGLGLGFHGSISEQAIYPGLKQY